MWNRTTTPKNVSNCLRLCPNLGIQRSPPHSWLFAFWCEYRVKNNPKNPKLSHWEWVEKNALITNFERWLHLVIFVVWGEVVLFDRYEIQIFLIFLYWQKLTKGSDSWSLGELVHALVILSHYHAISSFVFGVGIGDGEDEPPCCCPSIAHKSATTTATASVPSGNSSSGQSTPTSASPPLTNGGGSPLVLATREIVTAPTTSAATGTSALGGFYLLNLIFTR